MSGLSLTKITDETLGALDVTRSRTLDLFQPTVRLGVTGLSRAGKTIFITSLIHNLVSGGRLPLFKAHHEGRIAKSYLRPQPDDDVPRFAYEEHIKELIEKQAWPSSTRNISQLRLTIEYETASGWGKMFSPGSINLDIVDYPGEWLLDLPLLTQDYKTFSQNAVELARSDARKDLSSKWLKLAEKLDPDGPVDEVKIAKLAQEFSKYLLACKDDKRALSTLPPGRFLLPGDLEGSPAVTFAPLPDIGEKTAIPDSLLAMMQRRFESYKSKVIRPFYHNHFARLDRQIILIDALQALNAGPMAMADLERALSDILLSFSVGKNTFPGNLFTRKIDKILIAATKADHLHHESHDRLEKIITQLVERAQSQITETGAQIQTLAMASVRSTIEASQKVDGDELPLIVGTPLANEQVGDETFDGKTKKAIFPGDLPENPESIFKAVDSKSEDAFEGIENLNFVRFRPPEVDTGNNKMTIALPHIRLDRALEFLLGDKLQ